MRELRDRIAALPGFGAQKAAIFTALLGKRYGVEPDGWREAAGSYGEQGSFRSVADVVDPDSLQKVRATKKAAKAAAKAARAPRQPQRAVRRFASNVGKVTRVGLRRGHRGVAWRQARRWLASPASVGAASTTSGASKRGWS